MEQDLSVPYPFKGTVSWEKLFSIGKMDWTLTIDRTWVLHFPDQLFNRFNFLTVCRSLDVKPVRWLSGTVVLRTQHLHDVVSVSSLLCPVVAVRTLILCCCCGPHPNTVRIATVNCYRRKQLIHVIFSVQYCCCSPHPNTVQTATIGQY